jgi:hypothetical protein
MPQFHGRDCIVSDPKLGFVAVVLLEQAQYLFREGFGATRSGRSKVVEIGLSHGRSDPHTLKHLSLQATANTSRAFQPNQIHLDITGL